MEEFNSITNNKTKEDMATTAQLKKQILCQDAF